MESSGAAYSPKTTKTTEEPAAAATTYNMSPASSRPPRQPQPGMDSMAAEQQG